MRAVDYIYTLKKKITQSIVFHTFFAYWIYDTGPIFCIGLSCQSPFTSQYCSGYLTGKSASHCTTAAPTVCLNDI